MPIYTKTGDKGNTSFFNGQRVSKADIRVDAYGTVDELNSVLGVVLAEALSSKPFGLELRVERYKVLSIKNELIKIQNDLLDIGSRLANPDAKYKILNTQYFSGRVKEFEDFIDNMTKKMPPLSNFILPGGGKLGALLHFARTVARRGERRIVELAEKNKIDDEIIMYINRLSDLLFTFARFINFKEKIKEEIWRKNNVG